MLALETGWTPQILSGLPASFRAACHYVLFARKFVPVGGLTDIEIPPEASPEMKAALVKRLQAVAQLRAFLFPEDV